MHLIPIDKIIIPPNRQRAEFDETAMQELVDSIESKGLYHAIVLRGTIDAESYPLIAGERRLRAIKDIVALGNTFKYNGIEVQHGFMPAAFLGELTDFEAQEAELEENIRRRDLTWQEQAHAIQRLHELRVAQAASEDKAHTILDTAKEVFDFDQAKYPGGADYQAKTRAAILVAKHLDDPDVARAKSAKEALKVLRAKEIAGENTALAQQVGATLSAASHTVILGDCLQVMQGLSDESFDVICTDPPYGIDADAFGDAAGKLVTIDHKYSDDEGSMKGLLTAAFVEWDRLAKPQAHLYVFCDIDHFHWLRELARDNGWTPFRTPLILHKINSGRVPLPEHGPRRTWEAILYAFRGGKPVTHLYPDLLSVQGDDNLGHGAQKPVAAYNNLLQRSVRPGDRVLDCFGGTGAIIPAAHGLKCYATVIEKEEQYYGICVSRLQSL